MRIYTFVFLASSKFASNTVATLFYFAYICQLLTTIYLVFIPTTELTIDFSCCKHFTLYQKVCCS